MRFETKKDKKLEIYVPGQRKGFPLVAVGFIAVALLTLIGTIRAQKQQNYRNDVVALNGGNVLSSSNVPEECAKGGINLAGGFDLMTPGNFQRAQSHGMEWVLAIAVNPDEAPGVADRIKAAAGAGLTTIVRICYHDNCGFKNPDDYVNFLKNVDSLTGSLDFYAIAGPNEPLNENWLPGTEDVPIPVPENEEQLDRVARAVAEYMNAVINGMSGSSEVHLLSPAFNMTTYLKEELHAGMVAHGANFGALEGIAGNLYNVNGTTITQWVNEAKAMYPGQDLYITETGDFDHNISFLASEVENVFYSDDTIKAFLLFNAFGTNPGFEVFHLTDEEIAEVLGGECSTITPGGPAPTTIGDLVSSCPFDGDFSHDLESCQINYQKETPAGPSCAAGTELCGEMKIIKCGVNDFAGECSSGLVANDGNWHAGYYITGIIEGNLPNEGIPTLGYLQSAIGDYAYDDRQIQEVPPCFYRNANNYFAEVDFGLKFDGRIGLTTEGNTEHIPFPVLGTAAGCLYYNQNDFYGSFNQIASGFLKSNYAFAEDQPELVTASVPNTEGEVKGIFDFISGVVLAIQGFVQKTFFNTAVPTYESPVTFCAANGSGVTLPALPVKKLNTADVVASPKSYEAVLEQKIENLTDTQLCDKQLITDLDVVGASCNVNGYIFTTSPEIIVGYDTAGNPIVVRYEDEKEKNGGLVDSATGNPILEKVRLRTQEISLDGMKRALASAYLDEAIFFHGLGTRPGFSAASNVPSGFRVIHNVNAGVEVPLTTRIYDVLQTEGTSNFTCKQVEVLTPIFNPSDPNLAGDALDASFSGLVEQNPLIPNQFTPCGWTAFAGTGGDQPESTIVNGGIDARSDVPYFKIQNNMEPGSPKVIGGIQSKACGFTPGSSVSFSIEAESWCGIPDQWESNGCYAKVGFGSPDLSTDAGAGYKFIPGHNEHAAAGGGWTAISGDGTADSTGCVNVYIQGMAEFPTEYTSLFLRNPNFSPASGYVTGDQCFWQNGIDGCTGTDFCSTQYTVTLQEICTPTVAPEIPSEQTQCDAGEFYTGSYELAGGKSIGRDYYIIPWMAQIPRMYARVAAVGTNYEINESGDLIGTGSGIGALDTERIPLCSNASPGEDCLVPASDVTKDPLFEWLVGEGVLSEAEIAGAFGQAGAAKDDDNTCVEGSRAAGDYESLMKRVTDFVNSQSGGSRIPWYVLWGIAYNELWTRCSESHTNWYSQASESIIQPELGFADGSGQVYDWTDKCSGDPYELALYKDTNTVDGQGKGIGQFMPGTFQALLADTYWYKSNVSTDTGALIDACISHLGITDRSTGKNYTSGLEDSAVDQGIDPVFQDRFSRERVGDSLCAMAVMLSEIAADVRGGDGSVATGPYISENDWTDDDIANAARGYYGSCEHDYCFNAINRARFAQGYFTGLNTDLGPSECPVDGGGEDGEHDYIGDLACPVGAGGGTDNRCFQGPFGSYTHCPYSGGLHDLPLDLFPLPVNNSIYEDKMRVVAPESGTISNVFSSSFSGGYLGEVVDYKGDSGVEYRFQHIQAGTIPGVGTRLEAGDRLGYYSFDPDKSCNGGKATFTDPEFAQYYNQKTAIYDCGNIHTHVTAVYNGQNIDPYLIYGEILGCNVAAPEPGQKQDDEVEGSSLVCKKVSGGNYYLNDNSCNTVDSVTTADDNLVRSLFEAEAEGETPTGGSCQATRIEPGHYKVQLDPNNIILNSPTRGTHSISEFIQETGAKVAVNANFFGSSNQFIGLYGDQYNPCIGCPVAQAVKAAIAVADNFGSMPMLAQSGKLGLINLDPFYVGTSNFESVKATTSGLRDGVSGILLIRDGQLANFQTVVAPYSALGWDGSGRLFAYSSKYTSDSLAQRMLGDGIKNAILLDGGSSQQLYAVNGGIEPSDGPPNSTQNLFTRNVGTYRPVPFYIGSSTCTGSTTGGGGTGPGSTGGNSQISCQEPIKIMPLGDSITYGTGSSDGLGYRKILRESLQQQGFNVQFVGSQGSGADKHEGHGGYSASRIASNINSWVSAADPQVVLLHVGTNNLCSFQFDDIETILNTIVENTPEKNTRIILARIIERYGDNLGCSDDPTSPIYTAEGATYFFNDELEERFGPNGSYKYKDNVTIVFMDARLTYNPGGIDNDYADTVHPDNSGFEKMRDYWLDPLSDILSTCN